MKKILSVILALCLTFSFAAACESALYGTGKVYVREKGGTLHLRSAASTDSESLGFVHHGDEIDVLMLGDEWSYIYSYREFQRGFIKTKYIVDFIPSQNAYTEMTLENVQDSSEIYPLPGKYRLDLDGDGFIDTVNASLFYDEYGMENFTLTFDTAYGSTGEATLPFSAYDASIAFAKLDETGRVYVFVTGDVASTDFETYGFYVSEGHMKNVEFVKPLPFTGPLGMVGRLSRIEHGFITIVCYLDVLGTRFYTTNMTMNNGVVVPHEGGVYSAVYDIEDLEDSEVWEYASLTTKTYVPCYLDGNAASLDPGTKIIVVWVNYDEKEVGFVTESGMNGHFKFSEALDRDWGIYVGGIYEEDAFEYILYAG